MPHDREMRTSTYFTCCCQFIFRNPLFRADALKIRFSENNTFRLVIMTLHKMIRFCVCGARLFKRWLVFFSWRIVFAIAARLINRLIFFTVVLGPRRFTPLHFSRSASLGECLFLLRRRGATLLYNSIKQTMKCGSSLS